MAGAGLFSASGAEAQETTVQFSTPNTAVVSITGDGYIIYKGQVAGTMEAEIFAVHGTATGGNFVPTFQGATGRITLTLRGVDHCNIRDGCFGAFGINNTDSRNQRLASLIAMDLRTVTMFAASGADVNEFTELDGFQRKRVSSFLLYHLITANKLAHVAALILAGANVNQKDERSEGMMHIFSHNNDITGILRLSSLTASVDILGPDNSTPLHYAVQSLNITAASVLIDLGAGIETRGFQNNTPLLVLLNNHDDVPFLRFFLAAGANIHAINSQNRTALDLAFRHNRNASIPVLLTAGVVCRRSTDSRCPGLQVSRALPSFSIFIKRSSANPTIRGSKLRVIRPSDGATLVAARFLPYWNEFFWDNEGGQFEFASFFLTSVPDEPAENRNASGGLSAEKQGGEDVSFALLVTDDGFAPISSKAGISLPALFFRMWTFAP